MGRLGDALFILRHGAKAFMTKKTDELPSTFAKETDNYTHLDIEGVVKEDLDLDTFSTVSLPNGNKLVTAKNRKTKETQGVRMLIKKDK